MSWSTQLGSGVRATFNFRKFKVALNSLQRIFKTLQKVTSYLVYHNSMIKDRGYRARYKALKRKLMVFLAGHVVAMLTCYIKRMTAIYRITC